MSNRITRVFQRMRQRRVLARMFRPRHRAGPYYPVPVRFGRFGRWAERQQPTAALVARIGLSLLVAVHLALAALLPGGRNTLFGLEAGSVFAYLTMMPVGDALGFYKTRGQDGFIVYKIYTQDGNVVEGAFPDQKVSPRVRYDRWAVFTDHASADNREFHAAFIRYLVQRLPVAPLKVELLSAKWDWGRHNGSARIGDENHGGLLVLRKLGTYDGLRKKWNPARKGER